MRLQSQYSRWENVLMSGNLGIYSYVRVCVAAFVLMVYYMINRMVRGH